MNLIFFRSHEAYHGESYQGGKAFDRPKKSRFSFNIYKLFVYLLTTLKIEFLFKTFRSMLSSHMEPYHGIEEKQSEYRNTFKPDIKGEEVYIVYISSTV